MAARRERMSSRGGKREVRRDKQGRFKAVESVDRSSAQDQKRRATTTAKRGQGDRGAAK